MAADRARTRAHKKQTGQLRSTEVLPNWRFPRRLRDCYRALTAELQYHLDRHGLRVSDWTHLRAIWDEEGLTQVEISKRLGIEKASSTAALDTLRRRGLVRGAILASDQRKVGIYLTSKGHRLAEEIAPDMVAATRTATRSMSPDDLATFVALLDKMTDNLRRAEAARKPAPAVRRTAASIRGSTAARDS